MRCLLRKILRTYSRRKRTAVCPLSVFFQPIELATLKSHSMPSPPGAARMAKADQEENEEKPLTPGVSEQDAGSAMAAFKQGRDLATSSSLACLN